VSWKPTCTADDRLVVIGPDDGHRLADVPGGLRVTRALRIDFADGEQLIRLDDPDMVKDRHVLVVQSTGPPQDKRLMTLVQLVDIVRHSAARSVTCFVPYLCYQRQDRRVHAGDALSGALVTAILSRLGTDLLLTVDKHSDRHGEPSRLRNIGAAPAFARFARDSGLAFDVVVSPDRGGEARAQEIARLLGTVSVTLRKHKDRERGTFYEALPRSLAGRHCLVVDDLCSSGSTLAPLCGRLSRIGARASVFVTHLLGPAERLRARIPSIATLAYSDSCGDPAAPVRLLPMALPVWTDGLSRRASPVEEVRS
jgi:ribose-phosphate pyrophosphokinase